MVIRLGVTGLKKTELVYLLVIRLVVTGLKKTELVYLLVIRLWVTGLKKTELVYLLDLFEERGERVGWFIVCEAPLGDWANGGFGEYGEYGFSSMGN